MFSILKIKKNTVKDIFDSQKRIDNLVSQITVSIDELNAIENQLTQYEIHLNSINDLLESLALRDEAETSKLTNVEKIKDSLSRLLVFLILYLIVLF